LFFRVGLPHFLIEETALSRFAKRAARTLFHTEPFVQLPSWSYASIECRPPAALICSPCFKLFRLLSWRDYPLAWGQRLSRAAEELATGLAGCVPQENAAALSLGRARVHDRLVSGRPFQTLNVIATRQKMSGGGCGHLDLWAARDAGVRAPCHSQTQGKIERWHQTLKNRRRVSRVLH
jgi:hypothetical protein